LQYFIDSLNDPEKAARQVILRVEVDILRHLSSQEPIKHLALTYFRDSLGISLSVFPLFDYPPIYLHLAAILRDPSESLPNKKLVLHILSSKLSEPAGWKALRGASANLLQEVLRLMVEPPRNSNAHQEYLELREELRNVAEVMLSNRALLSFLVLAVPTAETTLQQMLEEEDGYDGLQLQSQSYLVGPAK
jgi:hypothetical protein